jgi:hypothetical protein
MASGRDFEFKAAAQARDSLAPGTVEANSLAPTITIPPASENPVGKYLVAGRTLNRLWLPDLGCSLIELVAYMPIGKCLQRCIGQLASI